MLAVLKVTMFLGKEKKAILARLICPNCPHVKGKHFSTEELAAITKGIDPCDTEVMRLAILNHHIEAGFYLVAPGPLEKDAEIEIRYYHLGIPRMYKQL